MPSQNGVDFIFLDRSACSLLETRVHLLLHTSHALGSTAMELCQLLCFDESFGSLFSVVVNISSVSRTPLVYVINIT